MKKILSIILVSALFIGCQGQTLFPAIIRLHQHGGGPVTPPSSIANIHILAGQSNVGRTTYYNFSAPQAALYRDVSYSHVKIFNPYISTTAFNTMQPCVNTQIDGDVLQWGSELSFFTQYANIGDTSVRYLLKYGVGNTDLATQWSSTVPGTLYNNLVKYFDTVFNIIVRSGKTPRMATFVWMQGENDATNSTYAANYQTNLQNMMDSFTHHIQVKFVAAGFSYNRPKILIGRINGALDPAETYRTTVRAAQAAFCAITGNTAFMIDTDSYPLLPDNVHYDATGQIQFGIDQFNNR